MSLAASLWAFNLPTPGNVPKPTAEVRRFQLEAMSLRDVTFLFELAVKNPYPVNLGFDGMTLGFTVEGAKVFTVASKGGFTVPANSEKSNTFTVTLAYDAIMKLVKNYTERDWLTTVVDGTLVIPLPKLPGLPGTISFNYSFTKKIPAIKPHVALLDFKVLPPTKEQVADAIARAGRKTDPGKALGVFKNILAGKKPGRARDRSGGPRRASHAELHNGDPKRCPGPLSFDKLGYELSVNGERLVVGESSSIAREKGRDLVTITNTFSSSRLSKEVRALFARRKGTFAVTGSASIKLPDEIRKEPVPLSFKEAGEFSL